MAAHNPQNMQTRSNNNQDATRLSADDAFGCTVERIPATRGSSIRSADTLPRTTRGSLRNAAEPPAARARQATTSHLRFATPTSGLLPRFSHDGFGSQVGWRNRRVKLRVGAESNICNPSDRGRAAQPTKQPTRRSVSQRHLEKRSLHSVTCRHHFPSTTMSGRASSEDNDGGEHRNYGSHAGPRPGDA